LIQGNPTVVMDTKIGANGHYRTQAE